MGLECWGNQGETQPPVQGPFNGSNLLIPPPPHTHTHGQALGLSEEGRRAAVSSSPTGPQCLEQSFQSQMPVSWTDAVLTVYSRLIALYNECSCCCCQFQVTGVRGTWPSQNCTSSIKQKKSKVKILKDFSVKIKCFLDFALKCSKDFALKNKVYQGFCIEKLDKNIQFIKQKQSNLGCLTQVRIQQPQPEERERELNLENLFYRDCSLGSVKNLSNNQALLSY